MSEGYQVIESEELAPLIAKTSHDQFSVAILYWLVQQLNLRATGPLSNLHFEVIRVQYMSCYPAIGVKYALSDEEDREDVVLETIAEILDSTSLFEFVQHVITRDSWNDVATDLLKH